VTGFIKAGHEFRIDEEAFARGMREAPAMTYFWLRNYLGSMYGKHRKNWMRQRGVSFGSKAKGIVVGRVNQDVPEDFRHVVYKVHPANEKIKTGAFRPGAKGKIKELAGDAYAHSEALKLHQEGGTIRPKRGRRLAIPIATRGKKGKTTKLRRSPSQFRKTMKKSSELVTVRRPSGALFLVERVRRRTGRRSWGFAKTKSGKISRSQKKTWRDTLIPRWILAPSATLPAELNFYDAWDAMKGDRDKALAKAANRILKDLARGRTT